MKRMLKKGMAFLLALAVVVTMTPALAGESNADTGGSIKGEYVDQAGNVQTLVTWTENAEGKYLDADSNEIPKVAVKDFDKHSSNRLCEN